jgi:hypothetical protein
MKTAAVMERLGEMKENGNDIIRKLDERGCKG